MLYYNSLKFLLLFNIHSDNNLVFFLTSERKNKKLKHGYKRLQRRITWRPGTGAF